MPITFQNITITGGLQLVSADAAPPSSDPDWANVSLLMNTTSTNDQTNNTFLDGSTNTFTVTRAGTTTQGSFTPFTVSPNTSYNPSVNGGSGYFDGSSSYLTFPTEQVALALGSENFTIEAWVYTTTTSNQPLFGGQSDLNSAGGSAYIFYIGTGASSDLYVGGGSYSVTNPIPTINTWNHVAYVRNGTSFTSYLNGVVQGTSTLPSDASVNTGSATYPSAIGAFPNNTRHFSGFISNFRFVKGTAVYTSAFTPPTAPLTAISGTSLLLNFTNAGMYDATTKNNLVTVGDAKVSTTQSKFAPTSVAFDGTGDHLSIPDSNELEFGSGDFTIEGWIYVSSYVTSSAILAKGADTSAPYLIFIGASNEIAFYSSSNGVTWNVADLRFATNPATNTWHYIAVTRSGNTYRTFFNGVQANSVTVAGALFNNTSNLFVGKFASTSFNGYMQDIRLTKGVARYTETFTPPTAPFPTN